MANDYDTTARNVAADAVAAACTRLALHTDDPGAANTASNDVSWISGWNTGGTVRYFKKDVTDEVFGSQGTYTVLASGSEINFNDA
jgi:hypothetical protein